MAALRHVNGDTAEPAGWSEREAAVTLRDKPNASGGCLPSLTLIVGLKREIMAKQRHIGFVIFGIAACFDPKPTRYVIANSKSYESSIFRQHCTVCHGPEGEGKTLDDGIKVPSLRQGDFKFKTETEIYNQISEGGNGMTPFRLILTERELQLMATFVHNDLRKQEN